MAYLSTHIPTADEFHAMTAQERKVFENRVRRSADRQGYRLEKCRTRDPRATDYGTYQLVDTNFQLVDINFTGVVQRTKGLDLRGIAEWLWSDERTAPTQPTPAPRARVVPRRRTDRQRG
jgi:hypothetical protein